MQERVSQSPRIGSVNRPYLHFPPEFLLQFGV
jgi:hypothetical protein